MSVHDIIFNINNVSFSDFVSLTMIKTQADIEERNNRGYQIGYTLDEFEAEYPSVDTSRIYFAKGVTPCYYFDEEGLMIFPLHLYAKTFLAPNDQTLESVVSNMVNVLSDKIKKSQIDCYESMLNSLPDMMRFEYLGMVIEKMGLFDGVYGIFMDLYSSCDYGFTKATAVYAKDVMQHKTTLEHQQTAEKLKNLPNILTVYRGIGDKSSNEKEGYSWTLNENQAYFFACRHSSTNVRVVQGSVKKMDVIEYITDRGEDEVLIDPSSIYDLVECKQVDKSVVLNMINTCYADYEHFKLYLQRHIKFDTSCKYHGKNHTLRVLLLSLMLSEYLNLNEEDLTSLCMSVIYHDCKRTTDGEDNGDHGKMAATYYRRREKDWSPLVRFLIQYHSVPDEEGMAAIEADPELSESSDKAVLLLNILKDADALDRVRFGIKELDVSQLRFPMSKTLVSAARFLTEVQEL
ncbi:MAG: HD domain-containing protein [Anaerovoracaceae bacterium]